MANKRTAGMTEGKGATRRKFLKTAGGVVSGAYALGLTGCAEPADDTAKSNLIKIPDTGATLPKGDVTLRWVDSNDAKVAFWNEFWPKYEKAHPNITIKYDGFKWKKIQEILPLGIRNKTAHDVFSIPPGIFVPPQVVEWGWVAPLDDVVPDFENWKAAFPEGSLVEGIHVIDGKTYSFPIASNRRHPSLLLSNTEILERSGVDFGDKAPTWTELREAAKMITREGKGRFYGIVFPGDPEYLQTQVVQLAHMAGRPNTSGFGLGSGLDPKTGEYIYTSDEVAAAVELIEALRDDGSVLPGSTSTTQQDSWPRVQRGNVGMIIGGAWMTARWEQEDPDFAYGVAGIPRPDSGDPIPLGANQADIGNSVWLYAESKVKEVAGDIFAYIGSAEGQKAWGQLAGVSNPSVFPDALQTVREKASRSAKKVLDLGEELVHTPAVIIRNPQFSKVISARKKPNPDFGDVLQGIYLNEIDDPKKALTEAKDSAERALDAAIAKARKEGAEVSRDDLVFSNWNPREDYTKRDYQEL